MVQFVYKPKLNTSNTLKLYVLINRESLPLVQCGVQAGHSIAEYIINHGHLDIVKDWHANHKTMVFLEASLNDIQEMQNYFSKNNKTFQEFREPDLMDQLTACTFEPVTSLDGKVIFGKFKLLS
jgi:hypothetical protein